MWNRSDEELPPRPGRYLIYFYYQDSVFISYWDGEKWDKTGWMSITHWMEIPNNPDNGSEVGLNMGALISL